MLSGEKIFTVWIEAEQWRSEEWNPQDDNSDVIVTRDDGTRWIATFVSYRNIETLRERYQKTGECLSGLYIWTSNMMLIETVSRQRIEQVIHELFRTTSFEQVFRMIPEDEKRDIVPNKEAKDDDGPNNGVLFGPTTGI